MLPVHSADTNKWSGKFSIELKAGSEQEIGTLDVLAPLWQQTDRLLFTDVRLVDSSGPGVEGNIGLGFRKIEYDSKIFGDEWAWGAYGFFDYRKTPNDNYFSQFSVGSEFFTENWALRGNVYYPERDGQIVATRGGLNEILLSGTAVIQQRSAALEAREYALPGLDVEAGRRFDIADKQEVWIHGGYFYFDRSQTLEIDGPRLRAEYRMYDVFDIAGTELSIGADVQHDDVRGTDAFFLARLRIPIGKSSEKKQRHVFSNIERRMTEYVVRDKDIISFAQDINKPVGSEGGPELAAGSAGATETTPVTDPASGEQLNVFTVDNSGGGDCTQANPCTLAVAQANASYGAGDVINVTNNAGVVVGNADLTVGALGTARRQVVGGAASVNLSLSSGDSLTVTGLGGRPTLNGIVTLADDASIRNFDISSPSTAIVANGISNATIDDVNITSAAASGISLQNASGNIVVSNSTIQNTTGAGILLNNISGTFSFADGSISNASTAVDLQSNGGSFDFSNTTIQNSVTGVNLGGAATNANLTYRAGSINAGVPVDTVGISNGTYDFTGTNVTKNFALSTASGFGSDFLFVDATGGGTGTSSNRASADFAETNSSAGDVIVLVNDVASNISATNGFQLKDNQQLIGFATGAATADFTGANANVLGTFVYAVPDPTGNGAVTLSNFGGTEVLTLASNVRVRDFDLTTSGAVDGIAGNGFTGATINNLAIANAGADAFDFTNAAGTVSLNNSSATNSTGAGLRIGGGNAIVALNNFDISDTASGRSLDIQSTTGGSVTFDANSTISNSGGTGVLINNIGGDVTFNGAVSVANATGASILVQNATGNVTIANANVTQANAVSVELNGNSGDFTMTNGSVTNNGATGVAVQIDNTSGVIRFDGTNLIQTSGRLIDIGATTGPTAGTISFTGGALTGNNGTGIRVQNTAGDVSMDGASLMNSTADAVTLNNNTGSFTLRNSTILNAAGSGILGSGTSDLAFDNVTINDTTTSTNAIALTNATGTVTLSNSNITYDASLAAGAADGLDINNSALGAGTLNLTVNNTDFAGRGDLTGNGLRNAIDVVTSTTSTLDATITGSSFIGTFIDGIEIDVNGTGGGDSVTIGTSANRNIFTSVGGDTMDLSAGIGSNLSFDIRGNDINGTTLSVSDGIDLLINDNATATVDIVDNTFTNIGDGATDETIKIFVGNTATANSRVDLTINNNSLTNNTATGLLVDVFGDSDANATVNNNTFSTNGNNAGLTVNTTTANTQTCLTATGNTFGGGDQITLTQTADGSLLRVPGLLNAAALSTANGGVTVTNTNGNVGFNQACTIP